jgi:hypothetical protein
MTSVESFFEYATEQDRFVDYCLWDYPPRSPVSGKFRSYNLLLHSFAVANADPRLIELCQSIRNEIGIANSVWGVKKAEGRLSWELYFYDYRRIEREVSIPRIIKSIAPLVCCELRYPEQRPYFMFSIDLDDDLVAGSGELSEISVYLGNPGSNVSSGLCYSLTREGLGFTNLYYFYDARREMDDIAGKIACSAFLDMPGLDLSEILWPELCDCEVIVVANKLDRDGIYFSRINVDQLLYFLLRMDFPPELIAFVRENRERLDHLLFDVGYDYRMENGKIQIVKSAYYGYF